MKIQTGLVLLMLLSGSSAFALECRLGDFLVNLFYGQLPRAMDLDYHARIQAELHGDKLLNVVPVPGAKRFRAARLVRLRKMTSLNEAFVGLGSLELKSMAERVGIKRVMHVGAGSSPIYLIEFKNKAVGIFKPRLNAQARRTLDFEVSMGDPMNEAVSFVVDRHYGFGLTPPTALVKLPLQNQEVTGSLMLFSPGEFSPFSQNAPQLKDDFMRVDLFDYLIQNADRHRENLLVHPKTQRLVAIDHGLTFWQGEQYHQHHLRKIKNSRFENTAEWQVVFAQVDPELKLRNWDPVRTDQTLALQGRSREVISEKQELLRFFQTLEGKQILSRLKGTSEAEVVRLLKIEIPGISENELRSYSTRWMMRQQQLLDHLKRFGVE